MVGVGLFWTPQQKTGVNPPPPTPKETHGITGKNGGPYGNHPQTEKGPPPASKKEQNKQKRGVGNNTQTPTPVQGGLTTPPKKDRSGKNKIKGCDKVSRLVWFVFLGKMVQGHPTTPPPLPQKTKIITVP